MRAASVPSSWRESNSPALATSTNEHCAVVAASDSGQLAPPMAGGKHTRRRPPLVTTLRPS